MKPYTKEDLEIDIHYLEYPLGREEAERFIKHLLNSEWVE